MYPSGATAGLRLPRFGTTVGFSLISFHLPEYSAFSYDEEKGAYVTTNENNPEAYYEYRVYFSDEAIVKFKFESLTAEGTVTYSFNISSCGTTSLTPPSEITR